MCVISSTFDVILIIIIAIYILAPADAAAATTSITESDNSIQFISPPLGGTSGGYSIALHGSGFDWATQCIFRVDDSSSMVTTNATFHSGSKISCPAPAVEQAGRWIVSAASNDGEAAGITFNFVNDAVIFSVLPHMVPSTGGNVTLNGVGFLQFKSFECVFGTESTQVRWISEEQIECGMPAQGTGSGLMNVHLSLHGVKFSNDIEIRYFLPPVIETLHPDAGTKNGGKVVTILGSRFVSSRNIACRFGRITVAGGYINSTAISCIAPRQPEDVSQVTVSISLNGIDYHKSSFAYKYSNPDVQSIRPQKGYYFGGTKIHVAGTSFEDVDELVCVFQSIDGKMTTPASFISSTEVECLTPALSEPGILSVKVSLDGINLSSNSALFVSLPPAIITSMTPKSGTTSGLSKVHLFGNGFLDGESLGCRFSDVTVPAEWISSTVVICKPISLNPSAGYTTISYTNDGVHYIDADTQFLFINLPSVINVSPKSGFRSGGGLVQLKVDEITNRVSWACSFGESEVEATLLSSTLVECETPPSQQDLVDVKLLSRDHHLEVDAGFTFQYYDRLEVKSAFPDSAPTVGGTTINITIEGLREDSSYVCVFEDVEEVAASMKDNFTLTCDSPKSDYPKTSNMAVRSVNSSPELTLESNIVPFTIYRQPVFRHVHPTVFYANYPPEIEISGHEFVNLNNMACRLDELNVQARWISSNKILCIILQITPNRHQRRLYFSPNGIDFVDTNVWLQILPELVLSSVYPNAGSVLGGINTVITGSGFHASIRYYCSFGDQAVYAKIFNSSIISCLTPPVSKPGAMDFTLCHSGDCANANMTYTFEEPLRLLKLDPKHGPSEGGTQVSLNTSHILSDTSYCWFGRDRVPIELDSEIGYYCTSPPFGRIDAQNTQAVKVYVSSEGHHLSQEPFYFVYHPTGKLESNSTSLNSTLNENDNGGLLIDCVTPEILVRGSPHSKLTVKGQNLFLNDTLPIEECRIGTSATTAQTIENKSDEFQCNFSDELLPVGSHEVTFVSQQLGKIDAAAQVRVIHNPTLLRLEPVIIIPRDTVKIFVYGNNFLDHNLTCFMNENAYPATFLTSSKIICRIAGSDLVLSSYKVSVSNDGHFVELPSLFLEVAPIPHIAELNPPIGNRGINIKLLGKGFHPQMKCHAEGTGELISWFINSSALECRLPLVHHSNNISLSLVLEERYVSNALNFTAHDIRVSSLHPTFGSKEGGSSVVLTLNNFSTNMITHCKFGEIVVGATLNHDQVLCVTPKSKITGLVRVELGVNKRDFVEIGHLFEYIPVPLFTAIKPSFGSETGGKVATLLGQNFVNSSSLACYFDETRAQCQWVSENKITFMTPKLRPGKYGMSVSLNGVDLIDTLLQYIVRLKMTTLVAKPTFGSMTGGAKIQVFGTNFQRDDNLACKFGERTSTALFIDQNMLECIIPPHDVAESVDLGIVSDTGDASFAEEDFEFLLPFEIKSFIPDSGPLKGGTLVSIFGSGFAQVRAPIYCKFNSSSVVALIVSDHELNCVTPPMALLGAADVIITHGSDDFRLPQQFSYDGEIMLYNGPKYFLLNEREHNLTVQGSFFSHKQELVCSLDPGGHILKATFVSRGTIACALPAGLRAGKYDLTASNNGQDFSNSSILVWVMNPINVHFIEPSAGVTGTETLVSIRGHSFEEFDELSCLVDNTLAVPMQLIGPEEIHCILPSNLPAGIVSIALASQGAPVSNEHSFTFIGLKINSMHPMLGDMTGGTPVIIGLESGNNNAISHCIFGDKIVSANITSGLLVCETPLMTETGRVPLGLSVNGRDFNLSPLFFEYHSPVKLLSMVPNSGPESGGTKVNLFGSNFLNSGGISCYFGTHQVVGEWMSENNIVCTTPVLKPGNYATRLSINGVDIVESLLYYRSDHEVDVLKAIPPVGMHTGTNLTILGKSFIPSSDLLCSFGEFGVSSAFYIGPTEIRCESPVVEISNTITTYLRVSLNGVDFSASSTLFSISPLPEINMLYPAQGLVSGGTHIVVKGMHFMASQLMTPACIFGKIVVPAVIQSNIELNCISPSVEHGGYVSLTVSTNGVDQTRVGDASFLYLPNVETLSIEPNSGSHVGGTLVTITGKKFAQSHDIKCHFGESATDAAFLNDKQLQCRSPSHRLGVVPFYVSTFETKVMSDLAFEFYMPHQVISAFPLNGPYRGGTLVKVHGRNFRSDVGYLCRFGNASSPALFISFEFVECKSPIIEIVEQHTPQQVVLDIIEEGSNYTHKELIFTYISLFVIEEIRPRFVPFEGDTNIVLLGKYANATKDVWCRFVFNFSSDEIVMGEFVDSNRVYCRAPSFKLLSQDHAEVNVQVSSNSHDWSGSLTLIYVTRPIIDSLHPKLGPVTGGTRVSISGSNFPHDQLWCNFKGVGMVRAEWETSEKIHCISPPLSLYPNNAEITLRSEDGSLLGGSDHVYFNYHKDLSLKEIYPDRGYVIGGSTVTIFGTGFIDIDTMYCHFGSVLESATFISSNSIECRTPQVDHSKAVQVGVSLNGQDIVSHSALIFHYDQQPELDRIVPSNIPITNVFSSGNYFITIFGKFFINTTSARCLFGHDEFTNASFASESEIKCALPNITEPGVYPISISPSSGVEFSRQSINITFVKPIEITSIHPSAVQEGSETVLIISGDHFISSPSLQCHFGEFGHLWTQAVWKNKNTIECMSPPLNLTAGGHTLIGVTNNGGHDISVLFPLEVTARARFLSMYPNQGYTSGGTDVSIVLGYLRVVANRKMQCNFGDQTVPATITRSVVACMSPPNPCGEVLVVLMIEGETQPLASGIFEYIDEPIVKSVEPRVGAVDGGTAVTLRGSHFEGVTHCRFHSIIVPVAAIPDSRHVICLSPISDMIQDVKVQVTHNGQDFAPSEATFSYRPRPIIFNATPSFGAANIGGKTVYISGRNFFASPLLSCRCHESVMKATFISETLISCKMPQMELGRYPLDISLNGADFIHSGLSYDSINLPQVSSIHPKVGAINASTTVIVNTTALSKTDRLACHFGEQVVTAEMLDRNSLLCNTPAANETKRVNVSISIAGHRLYEDDKYSLQFTYVDHPIIQSISPEFGWTIGASNITMIVQKLEPFTTHKFFCSFGGSDSSMTEAKLSKGNIVECVSPQFDDDHMFLDAPITLMINDGVNYMRIIGPVFKYLAPSIITGIEPTFGSVQGGSSVRVFGVNFAKMDDLHCIFAQSTVMARWINKGEIQCVSPEYAGEGGREVTVHIGFGTSTTLSVESHGVFNYVNNPIIRSFNPKFGSIKGGTPVTLQLVYPWENSTNHVACRFGNSSLTNVHAVSKDEIVCIAPPSENEVQGVLIFLHATHGQKVLSTSGTRFTYMDQIKVLSLTPNSGSLTGGTAIYIRAIGLEEADPTIITCHFDDLVVPVKLCAQDDSNIWTCECITPSVNASDTVTLGLGLNGRQDVASVGQLFRFYKPPEILSIQPSTGFLEGGELVRVNGINFFQSPSLKCTFDGLESDAILYISSNEVLCSSPLSRSLVTVQVQVSNNGVDFTGGKDFTYTHRPVASSVMPNSAKWNVISTISIVGKHLARVKSCRFGNTDQAFPSFNVSNFMLSCSVPPADVFLQPISSDFRIPVFLETENTVVSTGLVIRYENPHPIPVDTIYEPTLIRVVPSHAASNGGQWIRVHGRNFINRLDFKCIFGDILAPEVRYISSSEIHCMTPRHIPETVLFGVTNGEAPFELFHGFNFTFIRDFSITSITPSFGSIHGGVKVTLYGSFPTTGGNNVVCKFGLYGVANGEIVTQNQITCNSPKASNADTVELSVSMDGGENFSQSTYWFSYELEAELLEITPNYGYRFTNTTSIILIRGKNFKNMTDLKCLFGEVETPARFISHEKVSCIYPPSVDLGKVIVRVFVKRDTLPSSWRYFEYIDPPFITSYAPHFGGASLGVSETIIRGRRFSDLVQHYCMFGDSPVRATFVDSSTLKCYVPSHQPGEVRFSVIDQYSFPHLGFEHDEPYLFHYVPESSIHSVNPVWWITTKTTHSLSFIKGSNLNINESNVVSRLAEDLMIASLNRTRCLLHESWIEGQFYCVSSTNGTHTSLASHNLTLCEPGTFQPQSGQDYCILCPVGYFCPLFGMSKPLICPIGFICSRLGLTSPSSSCLAGHYCLEGTKSASEIAKSSTNQWIVNHVTGVITAKIANAGSWDNIARESPASGSRLILHPPVHANIKAQQPFPCASGFYCSVGVGTTEHRKGDLTTPQPCHNGYFCALGSKSPEGSGACPPGFYCATPLLATACDVGHYCPGNANTFPLPCFPGSYSGARGQSICNLCEVGYQCPGWGRSKPELCQAGYVCDEPGLPAPEKPCPPGYYCNEGTSTDDPQSPTGKPPLPCPHGLFCLYGVARRDLSLIVGLPSFDLSFPQNCAEGYFCSGNSSNPLGDGPCFPGHYCPTSSKYPIEVPPGTVAADRGSIVPTLCLPGTFSPRPGSVMCSPCPAGFSCLSYGTFTPRICRPGTYRSTADSIPCKPCPERTYSSESGLTDISQCLPCLEGHVCGYDGLIDVRKAAVCPEGHTCGYVTNRPSQYSQQCAGGCYCGNQTGVVDQYSSYCTSGHYCQRGTPEKLQRKCPRSHFCPIGSSFPSHLLTRCPRQTISNIGSEAIESCVISPVAICDKKLSSLTNPFSEISYHPLVTDTGAKQYDLGEVEVKKKILPLNKNSSNIRPWKNDTVEVVRVCPSLEIVTSNFSNFDAITVIGRNFRNSSELTCRFRVCRSSKLAYSGEDLILPNTCNNGNGESNFFGPSILVRAMFVNENRVKCQFPNLESLGDSGPLLTTSAPLTKAMVCMRDENNNIFLSRECNTDQVSSGDCAFESTIPSFGLRIRIYSLFMPCFESEMIDVCLNPCRSRQVHVDVSNDGKKFSGDSTMMPYTSSSLVDTKSDLFVVKSTFSVFNLVENKTKAILDETDMSSFNTGTYSDKLLCHRPSVVDEGSRISEDGWFRANYMTRVIISFDWRHIPSHIVYNEHYKLAIFVRPSRCDESKCLESERKYQIIENIPCLQPLELPTWFESASVQKNQMINLTMLSLDDVIFKVEVHVTNGVSLSLADFFERTMTIDIENPERAKTTSGENKMTRSLSPLVSWEESPVPMHHMFGIRYDKSMFDQVSSPMNLPPRWKSFERGRVLLSMNVTHENNAPTIKDKMETTEERSKDFWNNPYGSSLAAKEQTDMYFETWHGLDLAESDNSFKYDHNSIILPYLPYFSNCREFDSYVPLWAVVESSNQCNLPGVTTDRPENWWRRRIPPLPHQDDVKSIGPKDFLEFYPVADWCERKLYCQYEEDLSEVDVLPRWFEVDTGATLFSIIRDPINYFNYTGRYNSTISKHDGGGQRFIDRIDSLEAFIPVKVDRSPALNVEDGCTTTCVPRKITLDISYQQVDVHTKRIVQVKLFYDKFDKNYGDDRYELQVKFYALDYQELVIKFAFSRGLFLLLFSQIGFGTIIAACAYWIVIRITTRLEKPPALRITRFLLRIFPPALGGVFVGLVPISVVTFSVYYLLKGHEHFGTPEDMEGRQWSLLSAINLNYSDATIDPDLLHFVRQGRIGFAFLSMALVSFYFTSLMFVPKGRITSNSTRIVPYSAITCRSISWRRSNFIYTSILMSILLVVIVEWSFWRLFGTYIWEAIIFMKFLSMIVGSLVDAQLGEALLSAPVMAAMGMVQGIVTMSANDFMDFLLSYIVGFGFLMIERMYIGPMQADFMTWMAVKLEQLSYAVFPKIRHDQSEESAINESIEEDNNETLEQLLGSFANYSCDTLSLLYYPFIMMVILIFRDEAEITKIYGIKEADMEYYILFALAIIPFQIIADAFLHNSLELLHGWKILDYLEYCRLRFYQREVWWKGLESNTLDECIEDSLQSIDQLCFSSQYYMLITIHVNAIVYFVLGVEMMARANYNLFGDPAMIVILTAVIICSTSMRALMFWIAKSAVWPVRSDKRNWHDHMQTQEDTNLDNLGDVQTSTDHDLYQMEMRITDETFRYKFLRYNRSWILNQNLVTPRVTQRMRPHLINQLSRILGSVNEYISSDSEDDEDYEFEMPAINASTRTIARSWLMHASRLLKLRAIVQPIVQQSRGNECEICLSRNLLQVQLKYPLEEIDNFFVREYGDYGNQVDQVLFKRFFRSRQQYQTICLLCIQHQQKKREIELLTDDRDEDIAPTLSGLTGGLNESSTSIMERWYRKAQEKLQHQQH